MIKLSILFIQFSNRSNQRKHTIAYTHKRALRSLISCNKFMSNPEYWMEYYIKNGTTVGPVNGEQYFIQDSVEEKLNLKYLPATLR